MRTAAALLLVVVLGGCAPAAPRADVASATRLAAVEEEGERSTLAAVRARGTLRCGTDEAGFWSPRGLGGGFARDLCGVVAAAVLGDATAVDRVPVADGVATLAAREADVVIGSMAWAVSRDGAGGVAFTTPMFYDGVGVIVRADGVSDLAGLADAIVCVPEGRLTAGAVRRLEQHGARPLSFTDTARVEAAFRARACDAWADDVTRLIEARSRYAGDPDELAILSEQLTLRPLAPAVAQGDAAWGDAVSWALFAPIAAEEAGLGREGVARREGTDDAAVRRLLGLRTAEPGERRPVRLNPGLGLPADFAAQAVGQVGSFAEIHARHLGALGAPRGMTALADDGGLLWAPPLR